MDYPSECADRKHRNYEISVQTTRFHYKATRFHYKATKFRYKTTRFQYKAGRNRCDQLLTIPYFSHYTVRAFNFRRRRHDLAIWRWNNPASVRLPIARNQ